MFGRILKGIFWFTLAIIFGNATLYDIQNGLWGRAIFWVMVVGPFIAYNWSVSMGFLRKGAWRDFLKDEAENDDNKVGLDPKPAKESLRLITYHEAGHAVASYLLGLRLQGVSILSSEEAEGRCFHDEPPERLHSDLGLSDEIRDRLQRQVVACAAGEAAVEILSGETDWEERGGNDMKHAVDLLSYIQDRNDSDFHEHFKPLYERATHILRENWEAVEALARRLLSVHELNRHEAIDLIKSTSRTGPLR